jgi:hypothetical protein
LLLSPLVRSEAATRIAAGLALVAAGAAVWLAARAPGGATAESVPPATTAAAPPAADGGESERAIAALRDLLLEEVTARERLEGEVAALRAELRDGRSAAQAAARGAAAAATSGASPTWFDAEALRDAGLPADEIARLRERFESQELATLYLRDRATREGWLGTPRFAEESRALAERARTLREELGDERFDWYLYATGQLNRVEIGDLLSTSPAAEAGIERGDLVLRYDGTPVFTPAELRDATAGGRAGERVAIDLERAGERVRVWVPRGPLGVRLGVRRERPQG